MNLSSIRSAIAQWISPDDNVARLNATIKTQDQEIMATRQQLADSSSSLAAAAGQVATLTGGIADRDKTISTQATTISAQNDELTAWAAQADQSIADEQKLKDSIAAVATPAA